MHKLSDFKLLASISLDGVPNVDVSGLVVVVGPNSSGKSRFLRDIYERIGGASHSLVVARDIQLRIPDSQELLKCLETEGFLETIYDEQGTAQLRPRTMNLGSGSAIPQIASTQPQQWSRDSTMLNARKRNDYLGYFGQYLITGLFLDRRLLATNATNTYDFLAERPQNELHALYHSTDARSELLKEMQLTFNKAVWPDISRGSVMCLKVAESGTLPSAEDRLLPGPMAKYRAIESEGDGMKSYVSICTALLLGRRPVCVVDEPEMCLHPPQAYNLGRFIGKFGSTPDTVTFVATHSSHVLRGALLTAPKLQIIRLTKNGDSFKAHLVSADDLTQALQKPTVRAESILDGIFSQAVLIVESDTDRTVYQAVWETLQDELRLDVHFAAVGGTGGIADTCQLYRTLRIPVGIVADLDLVVEGPKLERILALMVPSAQREHLLQRARQIASEIKALPPSITPTELRNRVSAIISQEMNWEANDDIEVRANLSQVANEIDRMRRLKRGGINSLPFPTGESLRVLLEDLAFFGIFLVPVGELEEWLSVEQVRSSKTSKGQWANEAASTIRRIGAQPGGIWDFMRRAGRFLVAMPPAISDDVVDGASVVSH